MDRLKHIVEAQQFSREWLEKELFPLAQNMKRVLGAKRSGCQVLSGKGMISFFYEPSTRTRASFEIAMNKMGGTVIFSTENAKEFSSTVKGETLEDTMRVLNRYYPDVIVSRFGNEGDARRAADVSSAPIINAGDGAGQHPTQALLDIYTIHRELGHIDGISIALVGDLVKGRTVRSLCYLLGKFTDIRIYLVSPENTRIRQDIKDYLEKHNIWATECSSLKLIVSDLDVIYQTRPQIERGTSLDLSKKAREAFTVTEETLKHLKSDAIIMHPMPRTSEIALGVDKDPRAVYLTSQIDSGLFVRMALLKMVICG